jgi:hypothetical protein
VEEHIASDCQLPFNGLHVVISQKIQVSIFSLACAQSNGKTTARNKPPILSRDVSHSKRQETVPHVSGDQINKTKQNKRKQNKAKLRASVASYGYVPSSPILVTLMMEALSSSETSVLTRATWRNTPRRCHST